MLWFSDGVDILSDHNSGLRSGCFIAMEAVDWLVENFEEQTSRAAVVTVLQVNSECCHGNIALLCRKWWMKEGWFMHQAARGYRL